MAYWLVYEQKSGGILALITGEFQAPSAEQALIKWVEKFGDNYGKVIILPNFSTRYHQAFVGATTHA